LLVPGPAQSAYIRAPDAEGGVQDEWVTLTRNLTLLSARRSNELEIDLSGSREETMMVGNFEHGCFVFEESITQKLNDDIALFCDMPYRISTSYLNHQPCSTHIHNTSSIMNFKSHQTSTLATRLRTS
jgi:hypothetical protein